MASGQVGTVDLQEHFIDFLDQYCTKFYYHVSHQIEYKLFNIHSVLLISILYSV